MQMTKHSPRLPVLQAQLQAEAKRAATKCNSTALGKDCHDFAVRFANVHVWLSQADAGEGEWMLCPLASLQRRMLLTDAAHIFLKGFLSLLYDCQARLLPCLDARKKALDALLLTSPRVR